MKCCQEISLSFFGHEPCPQAHVGFINTFLINTYFCICSIDSILSESLCFATIDQLQERWQHIVIEWIMGVTGQAWAYGGMISGRLK
ncbi:Uncharacterised protein [uncultured archaeon]|nr:Uncharacterised protein [uncultured archaeon]